MKRIAGGVGPLCILWLAASGCRGTAGVSPPEPARSALAATVDTLVPALLQRHRAVGAAVSLLERGEIVLARGYGFADLEKRTGFTDSTLVAVASVSKPVTAWGVLRLWQQGALDLARPVDAYLSRWRVPGHGDAGREVTVARLLNHTSGLGLPSVPAFDAGDDPPSLVDVLEGRAGGADPIRLERPPGSGWSYSGGGYTVLELLVEERTGLPFAAFMRRNVLSVLGCAETTFVLPEPDRLVARGHDERGAPVSSKRYVGSAAAGLYASARDFARLLRAYHTGWDLGNQVLARATLRAVARDPVPVELEGVAGAYYGLGHGVHATASGGPLLYHSGGNPGVRAYFIVDPERGDGLFVAVNSENGVPVIAALREMWGATNHVELPPLY